jgi:hypothetical protein
MTCDFSTRKQPHLNNERREALANASADKGFLDDSRNLTEDPRKRSLRDAVRDIGAAAKDSLKNEKESRIVEILDVA